MTIKPISTPTPATPSTAPAKAPPSAKTNAAVATLAATAAEEAKETPAQTRSEAARGDHQAQRVLASQAAKQGGRIGTVVNTKA